VECHWFDGDLCHWDG
nr:vascular cell proliferation inhibitor {internal fragment} [cattle, hearts, aortas, Peptide Partial, 15 aa] [Bos taurus]